MAAVKIKTKDIIDTILTVLIIIFAIFIIIQLIDTIFGGSWTTEDLIIGLLIANMGWSFLISYTLWMHLGEHKGYRKAIEEIRKQKKA